MHSFAQAPDSEPLLKVDSLRKTYKGNVAVNDVSFNVKPGSVYGILGPNGSGKTTTLGILLGVVKGYSGSYSWFAGNAAVSARRRIGALLEGPNFFPWLSGAKNLEILAAYKGIAPEAARLQVTELLEKVQLSEAARKTVDQYSLGMRQRLAIASVLLGDPEVLVLDEPTNGLDAAGIAEIRQLIQQFSESGKTVLLASHILDEVQKVCSHVLILGRGVALTEGSIEEVLSSAAQVEIASENNSKLKDLLNASGLVQGSCTEREGALHLHLAAGVSRADINKFCFENGFLLNILMPKGNSLEERFLKITDEAS